jgi:pimeloyl-ACP methyl ester carboxylesterase
MDGRPTSGARGSCIRASLVALAAICLQQASGVLAGEPVLRRASTHPIRYYLSVPDGEPPTVGRRLPVLVCVAGADSDFRATAERYSRARGGLPFLVVSPCTISSTNLLRGETLERYRRLYPEEVLREAGGIGLLPDVHRRLAWDEAGLLAILADLKRGEGGEHRVFLTGFSGGGLLVFRMIARHPDRLVGAAAVCPNFNFWDHGYDRPPSPADRGVPVRVITGGRDPLRHYRVGGAFLPAPGVALSVVGCGTVAAACFVWPRTRRVRPVAGVLAAGVLLLLFILVGRWSGNETQADCAARLLRDLGYTHVERTTIPDLGHDPAARQVLTGFLSLLPRQGKDVVGR